MIVVYVIESLADGSRYTGLAINAISRSAEHNSGKNRYTKGHRPWKVIYTESAENWAKGRIREKYLKTAVGKKWLSSKLHGGNTGSLPERPYKMNSNYIGRAGLPD